ncbi:hypothetical protein BGZ63DRAFT_382723 [Mariannaea sp. PMI_226]|nr:hypothetical protein BGZ63DRAFT_382723 [Mariannaea sp. PMI_226]
MKPHSNAISKLWVYQCEKVQYQEGRKLLVVLFQKKAPSPGSKLATHTNTVALTHARTPHPPAFRRLLRRCLPASSTG